MGFLKIREDLNSLKEWLEDKILRDQFVKIKKILMRADIFFIKILIQFKKKSPL
jgi:hypothetical protein